MAEFLVKVADNIHANSAKDSRGSYKRGDIVEVYADGRCREAPAAGSPFYIIKMPGLPDIGTYSSPVVDLGLDAEGELVAIPLTRRKWKFNIDALTAAEQTRLNADRQITLDKLRLAALFVDKEA